MMPKSIAPIDSRPMGMFVKYSSTSANKSAKGMVIATSKAIEGRPRKKISTSTTRVMPIRNAVRDRMQRRLNKLRPIIVRNDSQSGRHLGVVQFLPRPLEPGPTPAKDSPPCAW